MIVHETNQGMVKAWNACLHAASRDWICIIHNDDRIAPGALAAIRHAARLAPDAGLIAHQHVAEGMGGWRGEVWAAGTDAVLNSMVIPSGACISRAALAALGDFDEAYAYSTDIEYFAASPRASTWSLSARRRSSSTACTTRTINTPPGARPTSSSSSKRSKTPCCAMQPSAASCASICATLAGPRYLVYMFKNAARLKDKALLRMLGARLAERRDAGRRLQLLARLARHTGWCPPDRSLQL